MQESRHRPLLVVGLMLVLIAAGSVVLQREVAETMTQALLLSIAWAGIVGLGFLLYAWPRGIAAPGDRGARGRRRDRRRQLLLVLGPRRGGGRGRRHGREDGRGSGGGAGPGARQRPRAEPGSRAATRRSRAAASWARTATTAAALRPWSRSPAAAASSPSPTSTSTPAPRSRSGSPPGRTETGDRVELGSLKGNVGNQQYEIPADADLNRHGTVMLYCTPFTVRIAVAELMSA